MNVLIPGISADLRFFIVKIVTSQIIPTIFYYAVSLASREGIEPTSHNLVSHYAIVGVIHIIDTQRKSVKCFP